MKKWLFLIVFLPCSAQIDRATLFDLLENDEEDRARSLVEKECLGFQVSKADLAAIGNRPELLLAMFQCLQSRADRADPALVSPGPSPRKPSGEEVETPEPDPIRRAAKASSSSLPLVKLVESVNTYGIALGLTNRREKMKTRLGALEVIINILKEHGHALSWEAFQRAAPLDTPLPEWLETAMGEAQAAHETSFPTLRFGVAKRTDFAGVYGSRGPKVYSGLYMIDRPPSKDEAYSLNDHFIYSHPEFAATYDYDKNRFLFTRLKNKGTRFLSLDKTLNKTLPLDLFPGYWVMEIESYDQLDRIRSQDRYRFKVEPGVNYILNMRWGEKRGVRKMDFALEKVP